MSFEQALQWALRTRQELWSLTIVVGILDGELTVVESSRDVSCLQVLSIGYMHSQVVVRYQVCPPPSPPPPSDLTEINLGLLRYVVGRNFYPTTHPVRALYARCNTIHWTEEEVSFDLNKLLLCLFSPTACLVGCWFYNCAPNLFIPLFIVICSFSLYM